MNVYDFDGTIFYPDCTVKFALYCTKKHPNLLVKYLPQTVKIMKQYKNGEVPRYKFEKQFFSFLTMVPDFDTLIEQFWDENLKNMSEWYMAQKKPDDLIISASPECIIEPIARRLGVNFVATKYDRETGVFCGNLMLARSKSLYLIQQGMPLVENFYSDALSDTPAALCAEKAHLVINKAKTVVDWPKIEMDTLEKIKKDIDTGWSELEEIDFDNMKV